MKIEAGGLIDQESCYKSKQRQQAAELGMDAWMDGHDQTSPGKRERGEGRVEGAPRAFGCRHAQVRGRRRWEKSHARAALLAPGAATRSLGPAWSGGILDKEPWAGDPCFFSFSPFPVFSPARALLFFYFPPSTLSVEVY